MQVDTEFCFHLGLWIVRVLSFFLQIISNDISELQKNQATTVAKIVQYKRKLMDLSHRVLQVHASFIHLESLFLSSFYLLFLSLCIPIL